MLSLEGPDQMIDQFQRCHRASVMVLQIGCQVFIAHVREVSSSFFLIAPDREIKLLLFAPASRGESWLLQERNIKALLRVSPGVYKFGPSCQGESSTSYYNGSDNEALAMKSISVQLGTAENQLRAPRTGDRNPPFDSRTIVTGLLVFVGYYLGAKLGFALTFRPHPVSILWPPNSILAALSVAPLIVTWVTSGIPSLPKARRSRYLEAGLLLFGLLSVSFAVLYRLGSGTDSALLYLLLPFLLWAAVQFGSCGASTALGIVTFSAIWGATHGHGPFAGGSAEQNALAVQVFLIVLSVPLMFLAAVIEERAKSETELRESEERFRVVADSAPVLIWMSGLDKLCTFFNKGWLEFTGRTMDQEMGNGWAEGVHPDDLQRCLKVYTEAFDARKPFVMQYRRRRHDGEYRWVSDEVVERHAAQGNFVGYVSSCVDVTELINKDEALRKSEERMRLAADAVHLGIWEWDLGKDEAWVTNARRAFWGWPASGKITLEHFISRVHPDDRNRIRQAIDDAIQKGKDYDSEYRIILSDGRL